MALSRSFIWHKFLSDFVLVSVLASIRQERTATPVLVLEGNGFIKKWSCGTIPCGGPVPQDRALLHVSQRVLPCARLSCPGYFMLQGSHLQGLFFPVVGGKISSLA